MAVELYTKQQQTLTDTSILPQQIEGQALVQLAGRLSQGLEGAESSKENMEALKEQVRLNWRVWTIIQSYLVDDDCELPLEIRENLLSLTRFIDQQTVDFLLSSDVAKVPSLVNINCQIGMGLLGDGEKGSALSSLDNHTAGNDNSGTEKVDLAGRGAGKVKPKVRRIQGK